MAFNGITSKEYEEITHGIANQVFNNKHSTDLQGAFGTNNKVTGASKYRHQIDVSVGNKSHLLMIECKCWNKKVTTEVLLTFAARVADIKESNTHRQVYGILVSTKGFDPGAVTLAAHFEIKLCLVTSPGDFYINYDDYGMAGQSDQLTITDRQVAIFRCTVCAGELVTDGGPWYCPGGHGHMDGNDFQVTSEASE
jgi:hypothetical protein